jgi:hypothetical protein
MVRTRFTIALAFALVVGAFVATPVSAATTIGGCTNGGTCGVWSVSDTSANRGATCKYETASYDLDTIQVKAPTMFGLYSYNTSVGWRFQIWRSTNFGGSWSRYAQSGWQNAMASKSSSAAGFTSRTWSAPDPNPTGWFKARIVMRWKGAGGSVVGKRVVEYDYYQRKWMSSINPSTDYCLQDW